MNFKISGTPGQDLHEALESICAWLKPESYLEIGIDGGESMRTVLNSAPLKRIVGCDIWNPEYCGHNLTDHKHVLTMLLDMKFDGKVRLLDGDSAVEIPKLNEKFDLILVDGGHDFYHALGDFCSAMALVNLNGVIVVDDWNHPSYPEVRRAMLVASPYAFLNGFEIVEEETKKTANCAAFRRVR